MNRKILIIIGLQTLLIIIMFWVLVFYGKDEYEALERDDKAEITSTTSTQKVNGESIVSLSVRTQTQSGILSAPLLAASHHADTSGFATVLSMDGLIELRTRYLAATSEANVIRATITNDKTELDRLTALNKDDHNISDRAVAAALSIVKSNQAKIEAAEATASSLRDTMRQQWGETLADWATSGNQTFSHLLNHDEVLLQISLPSERSISDFQSSIAVSQLGGKAKPTSAYFVSNAPTTDTAMQGKTYFYRAKAENLRSGMRLRTELNLNGKANTGIIVPNSAVVWYSGQAWVYLKVREDQFVRRPVNTDTEVDGGWFNQSSLQPGNEVVIAGAQLLLSEELEFQIKNENDD